MFPLAILPLFCCKLYIREKGKRNFSTQHAASLNCDQRGLNGVAFSGVDAGAISLFESAQNKLLQSGQEENRSRVQASLTAHSGHNKLQEQLRRFPTYIVSAI